ncbi:hypothetical protein XYCOK13_39340 [Xylanibacillus composti]|uniref:HTH deoR-type domain-containing protein n=1 Tax=Xylanibacillus composti TaxID=1572762 RepID=A0A8J4H799_9BACL|nr:hypothetical protein XYCOK13_39340 [Xylanibacillus composti]
MQLNRLFAIVYLLLQQPRVTARELAERFEVSVRTIYRDIELLGSAGIPVYMSKGRGGGISLLDHFVLNKSLLTDREQLEILSALQGLNKCARKWEPGCAGYRPVVGEVLERRGLCRNYAKSESQGDRAVLRL